MDHVRISEDELNGSLVTPVVAGLALSCGGQTPVLDVGWWRDTVARKIGLRQPGEDGGKATNNKNVLTVKADADGVRVSPQGRAFMDRKGLADAVQHGVARVLELCGREATASVDVFIDPDDSSESLVIKVYAPKPFVEVLADVRRFNIEWRAETGMNKALDDVLFMAGSS